MKGNQFYLDGRLYRFDYSGVAAPWPLQVWDDTDEAWQDIGRRTPNAGGLLVRCPSQLAVPSADWLLAADGTFVLTSLGDTIASSTISAVLVPDFVQTALGDVIGVVGR